MQNEVELDVMAFMCRRENMDDTTTPEGYHKHWKIVLDFKYYTNLHYSFSRASYRAPQCDHVVPHINNINERH